MRPISRVFCLLLAVFLGVGVVPAGAEPGHRPECSAAMPSAFDTAPAMAALRRLIGLRARQFALTGVTGAESFRVCGDRGRIVVTGTSNAVLLTGANRYLKDVLGAGITWNGDATSRLPVRLPAPAWPIEGATPFAHRFAGNDTMSGYTGPHWTFEDWQRELDVLAANGVNEVLVYPGQAAVYQEVFARFGYTESELLEWIPQPAHQPWWLLQNMSGYNTPLSKQLAAQQARLGRRIADAARALGMTPVLPGYYGTVPPGFADRNPGAHVVPQGKWAGFTRPDWLDPRDPYFARIADTFYKIQDTLFGQSTSYKMDLLHEGGDPGDVPVADAARHVQAALDRAHPGATWVILGWQHNPSAALLSGVDRARMLIVDGLSDRYHGLDREKSWGGTPYAFGSIWNFGGHTTIGANLTTWATTMPAWAAKPDSALAGIAIMPEANDNNPAALSYLADLAWHPEGIDPARWMRDFARWRYGGTDRHAAAAWNTLLRTAYAMPSGEWSEAQDGLFGAQPSLSATSAASWSPREMRYDPVELATALPELLAVSPRLRGTSAYRHDLVDVARQVLDNHSRTLLPQIASAYHRADRPEFGRLTRRWLDLMRLEDQLLGTDRHFLLGPWLAQAQAAGDRPAYDVKMLLTSWASRAGHEEGLRDYANRSWQGLLGDLYHSRWRAYFATLDTALETGTPPAPIDWYAVNDAWARSATDYPTAPRGDAHALATRVWQEVRTDPTFATVDVSVAPKAVRPGEQATATATFRNVNPASVATGVSLEVRAPGGIVVTPTSPTTFDQVAVGEAVTARFSIMVPDGRRPPDSQPTAGDRQISAIDEVALTGVAGFSYRGVAGRQVAGGSVLVPSPPEAPYRTATTTEAVLGQRGDEFGIYTGGRDLWGATAEYGVIYLDGGLAGAGTVTTRVTAQERTGPWARGGIVVRNDLADPGSTGFLNLAVTPDNGCVLSWDADGNGTLDSYRNAPGAAPVSLRLVRDGTTFTGYCSADGEAWTTVGTATVTSAAGVSDVGLIASAANGGSGAAGMVRFAGLAVSSS